LMPSPGSDLYKWRIPSCYRCNGELGKIEENLLFRLGLCIEPTPETAGIVAKAQRSYNLNLQRMNEIEQHVLLEWRGSVKS
jgi:hypothetical protein